MKYFEVTRENDIAILWLNNPTNRNLMNWDFWIELPQIMAELEGDKDVQVLIIAGRGKSFSLGLDVANFIEQHGFLGKEDTAEARLKLRELIVQMQAGMQAVAKFKKPVIAAVHRHCYGGGVDLISACDIRLCSKDAKFSIYEVNVAIVADMGSIQRLPYIIGEGATKELAYTGDIIGAEKALRIGLVNEVYKDFDALIIAAQKMAKNIAGKSSFVVQGIKHVMEFSRELSPDESMEYVATFNSAFLRSEDFRNIIKQRQRQRRPKA